MLDLNIVILSYKENLISKISRIITSDFSNTHITSANNDSEFKLVVDNDVPKIVFIDSEFATAKVFDLLIQHENQTYTILISNDSIEKIFVSEHKINYLISSNFNETDIFLCIKNAISALSNADTSNFEDADNVSMEEFLDIYQNISELRFPGSKILLQKVNHATRWIANNFESSNEIRTDLLRIASKMCTIGRFVLPDNLMKAHIFINGTLSNPLMGQIPYKAFNIFAKSNKFKEVGEILLHVYENIDGSGMPEKLQSWQIPIESRLIRVVLDFEEEMIRAHHNSEEIIDSIQSQGKRLYDHRFAYLLDQYLRTESRENYNPDEIAIGLSDLKSGMTLTRDIITYSGLKLVPKGKQLTESSVNLVVNHSANDQILGSIFVKKETT